MEKELGLKLQQYFSPVFSKGYDFATITPEHLQEV
jgi:hypothetical protein